MTDSTSKHRRHATTALVRNISETVKGLGLSKQTLSFVLERRCLLAHDTLLASHYPESTVPEGRQPLRVRCKTKTTQQSRGWKRLTGEKRSHRHKQFSTYEAEERITKVTDSADGVTEYTYDALGQLLTEKHKAVADDAFVTVNEMK